MGLLRTLVTIAVALGLCVCYCTLAMCRFIACGRVLHGAVHDPGVSSAAVPLQFFQRSLLSQSMPRLNLQDFY